jgi:nicotinamide phosphoribosyltransferase
MSFQIFAPNGVDSYKIGHRPMYTPGTETILSNFTPRSDRIFVSSITSDVARFYDNRVVFFGLQGALKEITEIWDETFFSKPRDVVCRKYARRIAPFVGGMKVDVTHFEELHAYGRLPLTVRALPEGSRVNLGIPVFTVHESHRDFFWIVNYLETWLSNEVWKKCTIATIAHTYRRILKAFALRTGSPMDFVNWQGHDFSCRGQSGMYDAASNSSGHLTSFMGTDTLSAVDYLEYAYDGELTFVGGSVPATEHSVATLDGIEGEFELFKRLITEVVPTGIVSLVSDGFDYWKVLTEFLPKLKDAILAREPDAMGFSKVVIRPDSGDPVKIVTGYMPNEYAIINEVSGDRFVCRETGKDLTRAEVDGSISVLWDIFGGTTTSTGHKLLDSHIGLIYGDSITLDRMVKILDRLCLKGFASANIVFGIGSYTYQHITRDTFGFAMKATFAKVNGQNRNVFKEPKTDGGSKKSARGKLVVVKCDTYREVYELIQEADVPLDNETPHGLLYPVLKDGIVNPVETIEGIRLRLDPKFYG